MDTEHRHELKENDLAHFLERVGPWWKRNGLKTMITVLVVLLAVVIFHTRKQQAKDNHDNTWSQLGTAASPNEFYELSLQFDEPTARALAALNGASVFNQRASLPNMGEAPGNTAPVDASNRADALEKAHNMVNHLLGTGTTPPLIRLNSRLLKAAIEENRGNFAAAATTYQALIDDPAAADEPVILKRAQFRLEILPDLQRPQPFGPDPVAADPAPLPDTELVPTADESETDTLMTTPPVPVEPSAENDAAGP